MPFWRYCLKPTHNIFEHFDHLGNKHSIQKTIIANQFQNAKELIEEKTTGITSLKLN
jgi:hypothetical protein